MNWRWLICGVVTGMLLWQPLWAADEEPEPVEEPPQAWMPERPWEVIEVAIVLDTSASMSSLIHAAQMKLWDIVQEFTALEPAPTLRTALVSYGNWKSNASAGWVVIEADLTSDLDLVSERLFQLTEDGFQGPDPEFVGRALQVALEDLSWTPSNEALKLIFVAGNERANQDPSVDYRDMADLARQEGVPIYTLYCGNLEESAAETWEELAYLSGGQLAAIDHRAGTVTVETPYDEELVELSAALNQTFLPVGEDGRKRHQNMVQQDQNAANLSSAAAASRAEVKTRPMFSSGWDLVDVWAGGTSKLAEVPEEDLPEDLLPLSQEEREVYLEQVRLQRERLKERIAEMSAQRRQYVAEEMVAQGLDDSKAFDTALRKAIRSEAEAKGFSPPD